MKENVVSLRPEFPVYEFHPLADVLPLMEGTEYEDLVASVRTNGQREDIVLYEGKILDGRNRYRACEESYRQTGKMPRFKTLAEVADDGTDPRQYVADKNLLRRHLTVAQRALYMAQLATCPEGRRWPTTRGDSVESIEEKITGSFEPVRVIEAHTQPALTNEEAGVMANVSASSIKDAKVILAEGTEDEKKRVLNGEVGLRSTSDEIRKRRPDQVSPSDIPASGLSRNCLVVPSGKTASQWCLEGMALEESGKGPEDAAKSIGMSIQTYREIRDIVLLATRCELTSKDRQQAQDALHLLDTTRMLARSYDPVRPIAERFWGPRGQRHGGDNKGLEQFENSIGLVVSALTRARELKLPYLTGDRAAEISKRLRDSRASVTDLIKRIEDTAHE